MIYDKITNIKNYNDIPQKVIDFIEELSPATFPGHYEISENAYANIDCYTTKNAGEDRLEAHKKYTDIQILLDGEERLDFIETDELAVSESYNEEKDIIFYEKTDKFLNSVKLSYGKFVMLFPHEAHQPQMALNEPVHVKKVVIKIKA